MNPFREKTPCRRPDRAECEHYSSYKDTLREDFNRRCGYCDNFDRFRIRSFTIDHFVPRNPKDFTHDIKPNYYYNLVYACWICNSAKSNKWFTNDADLHNDGKTGFIEPTSDEYTSLFKRDKNGVIQSSGINDLLASHIIEELKLWYALHSIIWKLERLNKLKFRVANEIQKVPDETSKNDLRDAHYEILKKLDFLIDGFFDENE